MLKLGALLDVEFTDLMANGQAVARAEGMVVFCFGPLPSERARVRIVAVKAKYAVAELLELRSESPSRVPPFCPVFGECGGCQVQHLDYPAQLAWKRDVVAAALARIGGFRDAVVHQTIGMPEPRAYRNKMSLVVRHRDGEHAPVLGFYRQRSHDVVPIDACPIVMPRLSEYVGRLRDERQTPAAQTALKDARHVVARAAVASGEAVVTITSTRESASAASAAAALLAELPQAVGIVNSFDLSGENAILGRRSRTVAGRGEIEETIAGIHYRVSSGSFFQVNVEMVARIFESLRPTLRPSMRIVDLYCGAGTFALFFAAQGCDVYGIEENARAVAEARANAQRNGLNARARFRAARAAEALAGGEGRASLQSADAIFLDPPRKGSDEATLAAIAAARVPSVWYLSCDPATLARDLKFLTAKGYALGSVQPFDLFPQTGHVEALATLAITPSK